MNCHLCKRPLGVTRYVVQGYIGVYTECEWCFERKPRPEEIELITDSFTHPESSLSASSLDAILDRLDAGTGL